MKPLKIIAHLKNGFTAKFDWSVSIDGILAYQFQLEKLGIDRFTETHALVSDQEPVTGLPISVEEWQGLWWYQCSRPLFYSSGVHTRHLHRRFNAQEAEIYLGDKTRKVQTTKGAYKNARLSIPTFLTNKVIWYVNGDKTEIERLLKDVTHIGGQRRAGHGAVREWEVKEHNSLDDCRFRRIVPVLFAEENNINGLSLKWAIRPPSLLPENQMDCIIPSLSEGV